MPEDELLTESVTEQVTEQVVESVTEAPQELEPAAETSVTSSDSPFPSDHESPQDYSSFVYDVSLFGDSGFLDGTVSGSYPAYSKIIENQEIIIQQNKELIDNAQQINSVLVHLFFIFGLYCVFKFVHFIIFRVIFSGIN